MDFRIKRDTAKCIRFCILLFFTAFLLLFIAQGGVLGYEWAFRFAGVAFGAAGIYLTVRYLLKDYLISVTGRTDHDLDLVVTEIRKNRSFAVCRISIANISKIEVAERGKSRKRAQKNPKGARKYTYNYLSELSPDKYLLISAEETGEKLRIKISYSRELHAFLTRIRGME